MPQTRGLACSRPQPHKIVTIHKAIILPAGLHKIAFSVLHMPERKTTENIKETEQGVAQNPLFETPVLIIEFKS